MKARVVSLQVHRWGGLFLTVFLVVAGLTGTVLAYHDELEAWLIPDLVNVTPRAGEPLSPFDLSRIAERLEPRARVDVVPLSHETQRSVRISVAPRIDPATGRPYELSFDQVFLDPYSGEVLGTRSRHRWGLSATQILPTLHELHTSLLLGQAGKWLFGGVAIVWMVNCVAGFHLTLPMQRQRFFSQWQRSWVVRSAQSVARLSFELHRAVGSWLWLVMLLFALSALQLSLNKQVFRPMLAAVLPFEDPQANLPRASGPEQQPRLDWEQARERGRSLMQRHATQRGFTVSDEVFLALARKSGAYIYAVKSSFDIREKGGQTQVYFSAADGRELAFHHPSIASGNAVANWLSALHMRLLGGRPYQAFVAFIGLVVVAMSLTGVLVWSKRSVRRRVSCAFIACIAVQISPVPAHAANDDATRIRTFESALRPAIHVAGTPVERWTLRERMAHWKVPGVSIAVIRDGKLAWTGSYGVRQAGHKEKIDADTVFSMGSVSKVASAAITLRLVDAGRLDLDRDVNDYLRRWRIPANPFTTLTPVTLRGILSHTAGLSVHGFRDYQDGAPLPGVIDTLEGRPPAINQPVRVVAVPGRRFQYSGGGIQVEQLAIEEVTGLDFSQAARKYLFEPLRMTRSTFENPLPESHGNIAKAHGENGEARALPRGYETMPEQAASGLWSTPRDLAKLIVAIMASSRGEADAFLSGALARQMLTEVGRSPAGLGPFLDGEGFHRRFLHGGSNDSYKAWMEGHPGTGNGAVIVANGANGEELIVEVRRAIAIAEDWAPMLRSDVQVPRIALTERELQERAGLYEVLTPGSLLGFRHRSSAVSYRVHHEGGALLLQANGGEERLRLIPIDESRFVMDAGREVVSVEFVRGHDGKVSGLLLRGGGNYVIEASLKDS